jgi:hypothetical protein
MVEVNDVSSWGAPQWGSFVWGAGDGAAAGLVPIIGPTAAYRQYCAEILLEGVGNLLFNSASRRIESVDVLTPKDTLEISLSQGSTLPAIGDVLIPTYTLTTPDGSVIMPGMRYRVTGREHVTEGGSVASIRVSAEAEIDQQLDQQIPQVSGVYTESPLRQAIRLSGAESTYEEVVTGLLEVVTGTAPILVASASANAFPEIDGIDWNIGAFDPLGGGNGAKWPTIRDILTYLSSNTTHAPLRYSLRADGVVMLYPPEYAFTATVYVDLGSGNQDVGGLYISTEDELLDAIPVPALHGPSGIQRRLRWPEHTIIQVWAWVYIVDEEHPIEAGFREWSLIAEARSAHPSFPPTDSRIQLLVAQTPFLTPEEPPEGWQRQVETQLAAKLEEADQLTVTVLPGCPTPPTGTALRVSLPALGITLGVYRFLSASVPLDGLGNASWTLGWIANAAD